MKFILICHDDEPLNRWGISRWLHSVGDLVGIVVISEKPGRLKARIKRELRRVGFWRFLDVLAFRAYARIFQAGRDHAYQTRELYRLKHEYCRSLDGIPICETHSPNSKEAEQFLSMIDTDFMIARCKSILKKRIYSKANLGTFVMHPGICPQYRNAHGCFWAMVNRDYDNIGMTLLKVDDGVDTGPVYGYYRCAIDFGNDTHGIIQSNVVFQNLPALEQCFLEIRNGEVSPLDTTGVKSAVWGQPWLTKYLGWKWFYSGKRRI